MDINGDGFKDIFSGSYSLPGSSKMVGAFHVFYGSEAGRFSKNTPLNGSDGELLRIPSGREDKSKSICTRPSAVDWDNDGDLDLIVGNFEGTFFKFTGGGKGKFDPTPSQMMVEGEPLRIAGVHSDPFVVDWDGDGDLDILSGSSQGGVQWAENASGALSQFRDLIASATTGQQFFDPSVFKRKTVDELGSPGMSTRVWVADLNGDSKQDILLGDAANLVEEKRNLSKEAFEKNFAEWAGTFTELRKEMMKIKDYRSPEARPFQTKMQAHWNKRGELVEEERAGFVWAYLQK